MPNKKTMEQVIVWLRSIASDKDSLDGINAQVCLNTIFGLKAEVTHKGCIIHKLQCKINELQGNRKKETEDRHQFPLLDLLSREEHLP